MPVFKDQNFGAVVGSAGKPVPLPVTRKAFHASGQPLTYDFALQPFHLERPDRITLRATAEAAPDQAAEVLAETYSGQWAMFGDNLTNPLPEPMQIDALEAQTAAATSMSRSSQVRGAAKWCFSISNITTARWMMPIRPSLRGRFARAGRTSRWSSSRQVSSGAIWIGWALLFPPRPALKRYWKRCKHITPH